MKKNKKEANKSHSMVFSCFWFLIGFGITAVFLISFIMILFEYLYKNKVYEGIYVENINLGGKTKEEVGNLFAGKNLEISDSTFTFVYQDQLATISARQADAGYDSQLISDQAYELGKTRNTMTNFYLITSAYLNGLHLAPSFTFSSEKVKDKIEFIQNSVYIEPQDALFNVLNNRVVAFRESSNGRIIDYEQLNKVLIEKIQEISKSGTKKNYTIFVPVKTLKPNKTTEAVNNLGIVEAIGEGVSYFAGSIPNRIYNISLAASKINGVLVKPDEIFSFNDAVGDVSRFTGYREAYIIQNGKTILGDGGGVCQVSTTLFRSVLSSGLPVIERHAHAYRVGYYEQKSYPGIDATIYGPSVDFKFKNDMKNYILIQAFFDPNMQMLSFVLYGKKDGRTVELTTPILKNQTSPPPTEYQDDATLARGIIKQIDYEAWGADVIFSRKVTRNGQLLTSETFPSHYMPWRAVYLRGTKEG